MLDSFLLVFIPLFVAIDPIGTLPLYLGLTDGFSDKEKKSLAFQAVLTGFVVGLTFGAAGHLVFTLMGITSNDFRVGGGLLLLIFSVREIFGRSSRKAEGHPADKFIGVVPLGIPMIAGPAMITTLLILHDVHSFYLIMLGLSANLLIAYYLLRHADWIITKIGEVTPVVVAKVVAIFLAAIGVMMIRKGIEGFLFS